MSADFDFGLAAKTTALAAAAVLTKLQAVRPETYKAATDAINAGGLLEITYMLDVGEARIGFAVRLPGGERVELAHAPVVIEIPTGRAH